MDKDKLLDALAILNSWLLDRSSDNPEDGEGFEDIDPEIDEVRSIILDLLEE